jgi:hypothetical protein
LPYNAIHAIQCHTRIPGMPSAERAMRRKMKQNIFNIIWKIGIQCHILPQCYSKQCYTWIPGMTQSERGMRQKMIYHILK